MKYNKLVRDKIPEIIAGSGKAVTYRILSEEEYKFALEEKLDEEVIEFHESKSVEEIADIIEVLNAIIKANGCRWIAVIKESIKKKFAKGGFKRRAFLEDVKGEEKADDKTDKVLVDTQTSL